MTRSGNTNAARAARILATASYIGAGVIPGQGGGGVVYPIPDPTYLPSVGTNPGAAYGMRRLVSAYVGPLVQIQRASDNANMDLPQDAKGLPDYAAGVAWANGAQTRLRTVYDQAGNSRNLVQTTWANMPILDLAGIRGQCAAAGAIKSMMFDGWYEDPNGAKIRRPKRMTIPNSVTYQYQNYSIFMVIDPKSALYNDIYFSLSRSADGTEAMGAGTSSEQNGVYTSGGGNQTFSGRRVRQQYQVIGLVSSASELKYYQDDLISPQAGKWSDPLAGGVIGDSIIGSADFMSADNFLGFVLYPAALSDANGTSVKNALASTFGVSTSSTVQVVGVGDSIWFGPTVKESLEGRTPTRLIRPLLKGNPALYGMGLSSQRLIGGLASNAPSREDLIAAYPGYTKRILFIEIGTNDIEGTVGYGATLYTALQNYITARRAAGYTHFVVRTLLPRTQGAQAITEMNDYNARVRAGAGPSSYVVSDVAMHPIMGSQANVGDLSLYQDELHPTGYGNELLAPVDAAAINLQIDA